jgi:hypothetical protein
MKRSDAPDFPHTRTDQSQPNRPDLYFPHPYRGGRWVVWPDEWHWVVYLMGPKVAVGFEDIRDDGDRRQLRPFKPE